jgi:hypothetical protein
MFPDFEITGNKMTFELGNDTYRLRCIDYKYHIAQDLIKELNEDKSDLEKKIGLLDKRIAVDAKHILTLQKYKETCSADHNKCLEDLRDERAKPNIELGNSTHLMIESGLVGVILALLGIIFL